MGVNHNLVLFSSISALRAYNLRSRPMQNERLRFALIGAGPTGLGAAYRLQELGISDYAVIEKLPHLGGLSSSFIDPQGFTWDIGGHVMFSHYAYYDQVFDRLMAGDFNWIDRISYIRSHDRWVPYPFQNNIRHLPREVVFECLSGLIKAHGGRGAVASPAQACNFAEFIDAVFGEGLAKHFMRPYNFKVWAHPPEMMNKTWIGERVAVLDVDRALRNVVLDRDDVGWGPNNRFKFPLHGGTGEFYRRFGPVLGDRVRLNTSVVSIDADRRLITLSTGKQIEFEHALSTMPLDLLCTRVITSPVPEGIRSAAARLRHSAGHFVGLGIRRPCPRPWSWMYFPESNSPFYRVTYLSNYSPNMTPDRHSHYSLLCEISESDFKPVRRETLVEDTIKGLIASDMLKPEERADIVSTWTYYAPYAYPTPTVDRDEILAEVIPWLESMGIFSRGRFGMWKYEVSNTDHSLMQGVEWANRMISGERESTIGLEYRITEDGRHAADHHRPAVAGSGERRPGMNPQPNNSMLEAKTEPARPRNLVNHTSPDAPSNAAEPSRMNSDSPRLQIHPIGEEELGIGHSTVDARTTRS